MILTFFGAAQSVTGSKHLITLESGKRILLDCGMVQGKRDKDRFNKELPFPAGSIHCMVLSHAHIDHCGLIPLLVKSGFEGKIYCTPPTIQLASLILSDSAKIQVNSARQSNEDVTPIYTKEDVEKSIALFEAIDYKEIKEIVDGVKLEFTDAGHILGSAVVNLEIKEEGKVKRLCFTGDLGRFCNRIIRAPQPCTPAEYIISESTYGDVIHRCVSESEEQLEQIINKVCVEQKGKLLIPAFSIGRTQELIYSLNKIAEEGRLPDIPVFVDSPLSVYATQIMNENHNYFNDEMQEYIQTDPDPFGFPQLNYIAEAEHSKLINSSSDPCIIISSSGMMEGGRIQEHLKSNIGDPKSAVLITGYCEPSTIGGQLSSGRTSIRLDEEEYSVKAEIMFMKEYSAHADYSDIQQFFKYHDKENIRQIFLVHGESTSMNKLKNKLEQKGYKNIEMPKFRASYHF